MKTEVYSWRLSSDLKSELEREARRRKAPISSILDSAVRDWLKRDEEEQRRLHREVEKCIGTIPGLGPGDAKSVRRRIRRRLHERYAR